MVTEVVGATRKFPSGNEYSFKAETGIYSDFYFKG